MMSTFVKKIIGRLSSFVKDKKEQYMR